MDDAVRAIEQAIANLVKAEKPTSQPETTTERQETTGQVETPTNQPETTSQIETRNEQTETYQETTTNKQVAAKNSTASGVSQHIKLNVTKKKLGKKEKLKLKFKLTGKNSKVMFKSSNAKIATVNVKGLVKAKKRGKVVIMAYTSEGATAICKITVKKAPKYVKFKTQLVEIANGKRKKLKIKLSPKSAGRVTFKSKDNKIVRVDRKGRITALKKGRTVVIAKTYNKKKAIIDIVVK